MNHGSTLAHHSAHSSPYPRLFPELRMALAWLYSLPRQNGPFFPNQNDASHSGNAHDVLMHLQSRNVRRRIQSICQRQAQKSREDNNGENRNHESSMTTAGISSGSTWLACLALLCHADAHAEEGLFCAQTLMHRLRRTKLVEAIDIEIETLEAEAESSPSILTYQQVGDARHWIPMYLEFMQRFHPLLYLVTNQRFHTIHTDNIDEGTLKGEMSVLALCTVTYLVAQSTSVYSHQANTNSILSTLGSCIAAIALRLRYIPMSVNVNHSDRYASGAAATGTLPLVTMVTQCFATVSNASNNTDAMNKNMTLFLCLSYSLATIPDTILGSPGGARGRLSIDPKCIQAAHEELRNPATGISLVMESIMPIMELLQSNSDAAAQVCHYHLLSTCERWQKFISLPMDFLQHTVPLAARYLTNNTPPHNPALAFMIAIFESATRPLDQILATSLGLGPPIDQPNKRRQSSKSKKRQKERLDSNTTDSRRSQAQVQQQHCGEVACHSAMLAWEPIRTAAQAALASEVAKAGEGPVGCLCLCAHACLPHLVVQQSSNTESLQLFEAISQAFQHVCCSSDRMVRALSYEPLFALHEAVIQSAHANQLSQHVSCSAKDEALAEMAEDCLFQCAFHLATSCGYPSDYFIHLGSDSDEDIEIERNDVRDILRTLAASEGGPVDSQSTCIPPLDFSIRILHKILNACAKATAATPLLPQETAVHTFSALAKPLNHLARSYAGGFQSDEAQKALMTALVLLGDLCERLIKTISSMPLHDVLPVSRLTNLAIASLAPAMSYISSRLGSCSGSNTQSDQSDLEMLNAFQRTLDLSIHASALSIVHIPELASESILDHSQYDIRGAMRGPGGEDHVGCLALMRLMFESEELAMVVYELQGPSLVLELCRLHETLKQIENERVPIVLHGKGVTPKSRRVLLNTISQLDTMSHRLSSLDIDQNRTTVNEASAILTEIFNRTVSLIAVLSNAQESMDADRMFRLCEATLDLASFSKETLSNLTSPLEDPDSNSTRNLCLQGLIDAGLCGFFRLSTSHLPDALNIQWGRMRGALMALMRSLASPDLSQFAMEAIVAWNRAECQAITTQCQAGAQSTSSIFYTTVIGEECIPSGPFLHCVGETLSTATHRTGVFFPSNLETYSNSILALWESSTTVLPVLLSASPEPMKGCYEDPRPTLCEAWFSTMVSLIGLISETDHDLRKDSLSRQVLAESCTAVFLLLLMQPVDSTAAYSPIGMSMNGAHTLVMLKFLEKSISLGPEILSLVTVQLEQRLQISKESLGEWSTESGSEGVAAVGSALLRAASGGLPPWAVEDVPKVYSSIFNAYSKDATRFGAMLMMATEARTADTVGRLDGVLSGELLAGKYFEAMSVASKHDFVLKSLDASSRNSAEGWRRFKVILKQACGGKKKGSGFCLKPSPSSWDYERI